MQCSSVQHFLMGINYKQELEPTAMKKYPVLLSSIGEFSKTQKKFMECSAFISRCTHILGHTPSKSERQNIWIARYAKAFHWMYAYPIDVARAS